MPANPITYTVSQTAESLDVSPATIRRYAAEFAGSLSPGATPPRGATRRFTSEDVQILRFARNQLELGETYENVRPLLDSVAIDATPDPNPTAAPLADLQPIAHALTTVSTRIDSLDTLLQSHALERLSDRQALAQLAADLERLEDAHARRRPDALTAILWFALGVAVTVAASGLALWLLR